MKKLGIAMIGYGGIGRVHVMAYRAIPFHYGLPADTIRIVGVATTRPETAERAAGEIGCHVWTADYRELLARDDVDVVDCCVPNYKHEEVVVAAAEAGKQIYCEKPLAMNVAEGQRMVAAAEKAGVKMKGLYFLMGEYDLIVITEAPSDEVAVTGSIIASLEGSIRASTYRAFTNEEFMGIINKLP